MSQKNATTIPTDVVDTKITVLGIAAAEGRFVIPVCIIFYFVTSFIFILSLMQSARAETPSYSIPILSRNLGSNP